MTCRGVFDGFASVRQGLLGCFGLTEKLAGVNSGGVVNTIATWDDERREFVITSPDAMLLIPGLGTVARWTRRRTGSLRASWGSLPWWWPTSEWLARGPWQVVGLIS